VRNNLIIAIDGPAAAGKSSAAKALAHRLGYKYLDTGALYRAMAWNMIEQKIDIENEEAVVPCCEALHITLSLKEGKTAVWVDRKDATPYLRLPEVTKATALISTYPDIRKKLLSIQRDIGHLGGVVAEGRDIGTVVFPDAAVKFFLDADASTRANRRYKDLLSAGVATDPTRTTRSLEERDLQDSQRAHSPLRRGEDAILIDSTFFSEKEVVDKMVEEITQVMASR